MKITVLLGGPSAEHDISVISGTAVANGLRSMGHEVFESDIGPDNLAALDHPADVVFPVLHGQFGESGELQEILEARNIPFVGSGSKASRLGMDKAAAKRVWEAAGLPTPRWQLLAPDNWTPTSSVFAPSVVKPVDNGSSIDVLICHTPAEATAAADSLLKKYPRLLVEEYIDGTELTVGLLEEIALAPIRIVPKGEFFDFNAKYKDNETQHRFDTGLPQKVVERCRQLALAANNALGARDLGRIDIMLDHANRPFLLEINTLPGFTPKSLLPEAARHAGIEFGPLVDRLVTRAYHRRP